MPRRQAPRWQVCARPQPEVTESQKVGGWQGPLWVPQPNPLPKQGHPEQAAQDQPHNTLYSIKKSTQALPNPVHPQLCLYNDLRGCAADPVRAPLLPNTAPEPSHSLRTPSEPHTQLCKHEGRNCRVQRGGSFSTDAKGPGGCPSPCSLPGRVGCGAGLAPPVPQQAPGLLQPVQPGFRCCHIPWPVWMGGKGTRQSKQLTVALQAGKFTRSWGWC